MWLNKLKQMKKISGKTSQQISNETNIPKSTIDKLFSGQTKEPYLSSTRAIVHCMGFTLDDLDNTPSLKIPCNENEMKLLNNYRVLDLRGKEKMIDYSNDLVNSGNYSNTVTVVTAARSQNNDKPVKVIQTTEEDLKIFDIAPQSDEEL